MRLSDSELCTSHDKDATGQGGDSYFTYIKHINNEVDEAKKDSRDSSKFALIMSVITIITVFMACLITHFNLQKKTNSLF